MNFIIMFIRSFIFAIVFDITMILMSPVLYIFLIFKEKNIALGLVKKYDKFLIQLLKYTCGVDYKVSISDKFDENKTYLMLMRHESSWETYFLYQYFKNTPVPVAKQELKHIPFYGQMLTLTGCIFLDRKFGISSIKKLVKESGIYLQEKNRSILIAPQGTRVPVGATAEQYPYKTGFISIAKTYHIPILPIVLDSGKCWPKRSFLKYKGTINVNILDPIDAEKIDKLSKEQLIKLVEDIMETDRKKMF